MNRERLLAVADAIEREEIAKFKMVDFINTKHKCGTSACVAGFAHLLMGNKFESSNILSYTRLDQAADYLDIDFSNANELFYAHSMSRDEDEDNDIEPYDGYCVIDDEGYNKFGAPALRWMVTNDTISWKAALTAIGAIK